VAKKKKAPSRAQVLKEFAAGFGPDPKPPGKKGESFFLPNDPTGKNTVNLKNFLAGMGDIGGAIGNIPSHFQGGGVNYGNFGAGVDKIKNLLGQPGNIHGVPNLSPEQAAANYVAARDASGKTGKSAADIAGIVGATPDYLNQYLGQYDIQGVDPEQLKSFLSGPLSPIKNYNPKDPKSVASAVQQLAQQYGWQPKFLGQTQGGNDPLATQALFSQAIEPYLNKLADQSAQGIGNYTEAVQNIDKLNPIQGTGDYANALKAMLGQQSAMETSALGQSERAAEGQAVAAPAISTVLDTLRANYINQLNNVTTGGTSTTPARINAPSSATKIATALSPKIKTG